MSKWSLQLGDPMRRKRNVRADAKMARAIEEVAEMLQLPPEAILIKSPSGRKARSDSSLGRVRKTWRDAGGE